MICTGKTGKVHNPSPKIIFLGLFNEKIMPTPEKLLRGPIIGLIHPVGLSKNKSSRYKNTCLSGAGTSNMLD